MVEKKKGKRRERETVEAVKELMDRGEAPKLGVIARELNPENPVKRQAVWVYLNGALKKYGKIEKIAMQRQLQSQ